MIVTYRSQIEQFTGTVFGLILESTTSKAGVIIWKLLSILHQRPISCLFVKRRENLCFAWLRTVPLLTLPHFLSLRWVAGDWGECSVTCGKGAQQREVGCVYQLQNGSFLTTRDLYCLSVKPASIQHCEGRHCLTAWDTSEWSQVRKCPSLFCRCSDVTYWVH